MFEMPCDRLINTVNIYKVQNGFTIAMDGGPKNLRGTWIFKTPQEIRDFILNEIDKVLTP